VKSLLVSMGTYHRDDEIRIKDVMLSENRWKVVMVLASSKLSSEDLNFSDTEICKNSYVWNLWMERTIQLRFPPLLLEYRHRRPLADVPLGTDRKSLIDVKNDLNKILSDTYHFLPL
jgi:hypothetical protein